jgi:chemotaxis methyl-accepting protein methylase
MSKKPRNESLRIWIAAAPRGRSPSHCILVRNTRTGPSQTPQKVQIFATDMDKTPLRKPERLYYSNMVPI